MMLITGRVSIISQKVLKQFVMSKKMMKSAAVQDPSDEVLVTKEGLQKLKDELNYLVKVRRKEVAARLREAISYGDLSENSEYEEAKNDQAFVESRIVEIDMKIKKARVIEGKATDNTVQIGSTINVRNLTDKTDETYKIVGSTEADPLSGKISNESPVGSRLLGSKEGDQLVVKVPGGEMKFKIVSIS